MLQERGCPTRPSRSVTLVCRKRLGTAGEGINLQFCTLMLNYDLPWNPNRLEQRMGRIHRYKQQKEVMVYNLVATNTRRMKKGTQLVSGGPTTRMWWFSWVGQVGGGCAAG